MIARPDPAHVALGLTAAIGKGIVGGALLGYVTTGTITGTITGAVSGAVFGWVGDVTGAYSTIVQAVAHGVAGGVMSVVQDGDFGPGFISASFALYAGSLVPDLGVIGNGIVRAVLGGTASKLGGGKFSNGAITAAYGYLFNDLSHRGAEAEAREFSKLIELGYKARTHVVLEVVTNEFGEVRAVADYVAVKGKKVLIGEIKDGMGSRFSANQKAVYDAVLRGRVRIVNDAVRASLGLRVGVPYRAALVVHALGGVGSRVAGQTARMWGVRLAGAASILGSGVVSAADLMLYSENLGPNSDCPGCLSP